MTRSVQRMRRTVPREVAAAPSLPTSLEPFAFRLGRRGALYGIGLSLVLSIVLMVILATFTALGEGGILDPMIAVWSPGAIFAIFSLYLFLGVRT